VVSRDEAEQFVSDWCLGRDVQIVQTGKHWDRWVAYVYRDSDGEFLNHALLRAGLAWHATEYSDSEDQQALENEARAARVGLWSDPSPIGPSDWRDGVRN